MLSETSIELIKFFTLFIWVLNGFIAGLLLLSLGVIRKTGCGWPSGWESVWLFISLTAAVTAF